MSVRVLNREYISPFALPTEVTPPDWLLANTGDCINAKLYVEAGIDYLATSDQPITINQEERTIKLNNGKKWQDYGFDINQTIKLIYFRTENGNTQGFEIDVEITNIISDTMFFEDNPDIALIEYEMIPTDRGTVRIHGVKLYDTREIQGVRLKYNHLENAEMQSHNLNSFIDGSITEMICKGLDTLPNDVFSPMELIGNQSGMSIKDAKIKKLSGDTNTEILYNVTTTNAQSLLIPNSWDSIGRSIGMAGAPAPAPPFQNQLPLNFGGTPVAAQMFLYNSSFTGTRNVDIRLGTIIHNNYGGGSNRQLRIYLHKWTNGASFNYGGGTILASYPVTNEIRGQQLIYEDTVTLNISEGDSYSLSYAFTISPNPFLSPSVLFQNNFGTVKVKDLANIGGYKKKYEVSINYIMSSFFEDIEGIVNRIAPQNLFNANSLTDCFSFEFLPEWNNPNISIKNDMSETERLGNTGWFNENYNQLPNNFTVKELKYLTAGGLPVSGLSYGEPITVRAKISGINNLVASQSKFTFGFIWLPQNEEQYKEKTTPFHENTKINTPDNAAFELGVTYPFTYNGYSEDGITRIDAKDIVFTELAGYLIAQFTLVPTADFRSYFLNMENNRKYAIWVSVADSTLVRNYSDRVSILLDVNDMDLQLPVSGNLEGVTNKFLEHPESHDTTGVEIYDGFLEDDVLARSNFGLKIGEKLTAVTMGYEVENTLTNTVQELDKFSANTNTFIVTPDGRQQVNYNSIRGYKLEDNNNKNWVKIVRAEGQDTEEKTAYVIYFAQKIRWESWIFKTVLSEYFDSQEENNGSNNNWLHFLRESENHRVNYFIVFDIIGVDGVLKRYKNTFPINFRGYDENPNIEKEHIYKDSETGDSLNIGTDPETGKPLGILLANKNTKIEIIYTNTVENWDINNVYCVTTLEIDKGAGVLEHRQLSSIWGSEFDNILIPLDGQQKLLVEQTEPTKIKASCLVDYSRLTPAYKYKITGRIGCFKNNNGVPIIEKLYDVADYENNYE